MIENNTNNLSSDVSKQNAKPIIDEEKETHLMALSAKEQRFVQLYLTGQYTIPKLAQLLELHPNTLWKWLKRKDIKTVIEETQLMTHEVVATQLQNLTLKATNKLNSLLDSPIDGVALQAVKDVLDRGGHKPKQEMKIEKTVISYEQQLNNLIKEVIDVEEVYEISEETCCD
ncbi:helix-turn-helix domain-containing protein [Dehalobacter sp. MCB1]|uniref:helix-turn-helix domain-containing protein n=1 Tax=Dehalobacter sp. MCB1 TaxID=1844756 RepID=UPI0011C23CC1|nr:helix-turn-helix domain-containing protein [Dehalobacter sp. MCB1]